MTTSRAPRYTHGHHASVLRSHEWRTAENSAGYLLPHLAEGTTILDVGCGPGTITADLAERVAPGAVVGVDSAPAVIEKAEALVRERAMANLAFRVGDAFALDAHDGEFAVVHAHQVLQHLDRPVDALREWRRVVGPEGLVAARDVDYAGILLHPLTDGLAAWALLYQRVHRLHGGEPDAGRRLLAWAHEAGFADVTPSASVWCFATPPDRAWWGGMWADRALQSSFATDAVEAGFATRGELEAISVAWTAWAEHPDGWMSMPHGEIIARG